MLFKRSKSVTAEAPVAMASTISAACNDDAGEAVWDGRGSTPKADTPLHSFWASRRAKNDDVMCILMVMVFYCEATGNQNSQFLRTGTRIHGRVEAKNGMHNNWILMTKSCDALMNHH